MAKSVASAPRSVREAQPYSSTVSIAGLNAVRAVA